MPIPQKAEIPARVSMKDQIYQTLCKWIIEGTLQPNEPISDTEVAKYFSASRTPVREALLLLERQKFVQVVPSSGTRVAPIEKGAAGMIYEALAELSGSAGKLACEKRTAEDIKKLKALNKAFSDSVEGEDRLFALQCDADFHACVFGIAANDYLSEYARQLTIHARRYEYYFLKNGVDKSVSIREHAAIIQAIEDRNAEDARKFSEENWLGFYHNRLEKLL